MTQQPGWTDPAPGQDQYGQGQYGQQSQYGQYGQYGQGYIQPGYAYPLGRPTNTMAIVALVLAMSVPPGGLVCGIIARKQIAQTGEEGDGMALAGMIIGGIVTGLLVILILFYVVFFIILFGITASAGS